MSAGIVPFDVATPVTRPPLCSIPVTLVDPRNTAPRCLGAAGDCDNDPRRFGKPVGRHIQPAQDL